MTRPIDDERFMRRALQLASRARGRTGANPMVGAVVVQDGEVIAEGFHEGAGKPHAEPTALSVLGGEAPGATVYVNLEPCSYHGRTPPCTEALIRARVARVVFGDRDPNPRVDGSGAQRLREAGIEVTEGVLDEECAALNEAFTCRMTRGRPLVTLKLAASLDGRIATSSGHSQWLSSKAARVWVHEQRAAADAVMVGRNTAAVDNPRLTVRHAEGADPLRIAVDSRLSLDPGLGMFEASKAGQSVVLCCAPDTERLDALRSSGVRVVVVDGDEQDRVALGPALAALAGELEINSLLVEGGATLATSLLREGLVDRLHLVLTPKILGGDAVPWCGPLGVRTVGDSLPLGDLSCSHLGCDLLVSCRPGREG